MSTRSNIALSNPANGSITSIYCHSDGYPSGVGATLRRHYANQFAAEALIALGNISSLGQYTAPRAGDAHSFDKPTDDVTVAYTRDRGDAWNDEQPCSHVSLSHWLTDTLSNIGYQHIYLFKDGAWTHIDPCRMRAALVAHMPETGDGDWDY